MDDEDDEEEDEEDTDEDFKSSLSPEWLFEVEISMDFERQADEEADEGHEIEEDVGVSESCESLQLVLVISGLISELI